MNEEKRPTRYTAIGLYFMALICLAVFIKTYEVTALVGAVVFVVAGTATSINVRKAADDEKRGKK